MWLRREQRRRILASRAEERHEARTGGLSCLISSNPTYKQTRVLYDSSLLRYSAWRNWGRTDTWSWTKGSWSCAEADMLENVKMLTFWDSADLGCETFRQQLCFNAICGRRDVEETHDGGRGSEDQSNFLSQWLYSCILRWMDRNPSHRTFDRHNTLNDLVEGPTRSRAGLGRNLHMFCQRHSLRHCIVERLFIPGVTGCLC